MRKIERLILGLIFALVACTEEEGIRYANVFLGTQGEGHCTPAATFPHGMVQPGPDSYAPPFSGSGVGDYSVGYSYADTILIGFSATHMSGVGCPSLSDILLMPSCGRTIDYSALENSYSSFSKDEEEASPGYYSVNLRTNNTRVELTATQRVALERFTYSCRESASLLVDLQFGRSWSDSPAGMVETAWQQVDDYSICGYRKPLVWVAKDQYYVIAFDHRIESCLELPALPGDAAPRYVLSFDMGGDLSLEARVALSTVSVENASLAIAEEAPFGRVSFREARRKAEKAWRKELSRMSVVTDDASRKPVFYSSLYHALLEPFDISDVDGTFRSESGEVIKTRSGHFYTTFSFWDTYRAVNPLLTIIDRDFVSEVNSSVMEQYDAMAPDPANPLREHKFLPRWALWGRETNTMIANHAVPILVEAILKGIAAKDYSDDEVMDAIWETLTGRHYRNHCELVDKYGYIPYDDAISIVDDGRETVARLLEGCYDDYAGALLAERLGRSSQADFLRQRSGDFVNVYDPSRGFFVGRRADGTFKKELDPALVVGEWVPQSDYCEGNAWHYLFHVQHDIAALVSLFGGTEGFRERLDSMFYASSSPYQTTFPNWIKATIGQYWHGNEPCHHVPFLYKYTDQGYKADALANFITEHFNSNTPSGLGGNDDAGQMGALYLFTVAGLYPVDPCSCEYVLCAPQEKEVTFRLRGGKTFRIRAEGLSKDNIFVEGVTLDGEPYGAITISHDRIMQGGELVFHMTSRPDRAVLQDYHVIPAF